MNILFVCSGNTCRSPMAAYLADEIAKKQFAECGFRFDSAGIATSDGYPATDHAVEALAELGIDGSDHRSKAFQPYMMELSDRVVCMTAMHKQALCHAFPSFADKVFVIGELSGTGNDIPDPYMGSYSLYCLTRDKLKEEIVLLLENCKNAKEK